MKTRLICPPIIVNAPILGLGGRPWAMIGSECFIIIDEERWPNVYEAMIDVLANGLDHVFPQWRKSPAGSVSGYVLLHRRAWTDEHAEYQKQRVWQGCPARIDHPREDGRYLGMCVGLYCEDIDGGEKIVDTAAHPSDDCRTADQFHAKRLVLRNRLVGARRPLDLRLPSLTHDPYALAIFMEVRP